MLDLHCISYISHLKITTKVALHSKEKLIYSKTRSDAIKLMIFLNK